VSPVRGRCQTGFGRTTNTHGFIGGDLYVDHASGKIFHRPQTDLSAATTAASDLGFKISSYHSDNSVFASAEFKSHCSLLGQTISFGGPSAHHQNGIAERGIGTAYPSLQGQTSFISWSLAPAMQCQPLGPLPWITPFGSTTASPNHPWVACPMMSFGQALDPIMLT
jgi:transposase InsO family protein